MQPMPLPLRDLHSPEAVGWWPLAPGWWLLALLAIALIAVSIWLYRRITKNSAAKQALKLLDEIKHNSQTDNRQKLGAVSILMRRVAITAASRPEAAGLTGENWLAFLDRSCQGAPFSEGVGRLLIHAPYQQTVPDDSEITQLLVLCADWLKAQGRKK